MIPEYLAEMIKKEIENLERYVLMSDDLIKSSHKQIAEYEGKRVVYQQVRGELIQFLESNR